MGRFKSMRKVLFVTSVIAAILSGQSVAVNLENYSEQKAAEPKMNLTAKTLTGKMIPITAKASTTIAGVKDKIRASEGIPNDQMRVISPKGRPMEAKGDFPDTRPAEVIAREKAWRKHQKANQDYFH